MANYGTWGVSKLKNDKEEAIARFNTSLVGTLIEESFPKEIIVTAFPEATSDIDKYLDSLNDIEDKAMELLLECKGCELYLTITDSGSRELYFACSEDMESYMSALNELASNFPDRLNIESRDIYLGLFNSHVTKH